MTIEPGKIAAGDSLNWTRSLPAYPAGEGYTLHYALFNATAAYTIDSVADGDDHLVNVDGTETSSWTPGRYDWTAYVTGPNGFRQSLFGGTMVVTPDLSSGAPYDGRSHARKMLDAIEAALEGRATADEMDLIKAQFGERAVERRSADLIVARNKYRTEVETEERAAALERGERRPRNIKVRFTG